jgi:hypothetical protein
MNLARGRRRVRGTGNIAHLARQDVPELFLDGD